jgi:hypothetical protein
MIETAVYWGLTGLVVVLVTGLGFLLEHVWHEHKGQHCRCPAHQLVFHGPDCPGHTTGRPGASCLELSAPAKPADLVKAPAEPGKELEPLPALPAPLPPEPTPPVSWPALYGPRIMQLDRLTHAQLLDLTIFVSGFDPEAVDRALELIRQESDGAQPGDVG